jgi:nitroimidazol reductase NimA-like FMN-containing flavoprotein (pyridoxamine 5'-phosphate oxidase superfamily)
MAKQYSKEEILHFLRENPIMSAAVNSPEMPISTVLLFAIDDDYTVYFAAKKGSYKVNALEKNPKISMSDWVLNQMLVQMSGEVTQIGDDLAREALDKLAEAVTKVEDFWPPILRIEGDEYQVFKVKVTWVRALDLTTNAIKESGSAFSEHTIS